MYLRIKRSSCISSSCSIFWVQKKSSFRIYSGNSALLFVSRRLHFDLKTSIYLLGYAGFGYASQARSIFSCVIFMSRKCTCGRSGQYAGFCPRVPAYSRLKTDTLKKTIQSELLTG